MVSKDVRLKDGRSVFLREFHIEDKEKLVEMYASLSSDALRWAQPPYTKEVIERWLSNLPNLIASVALHDAKIVGHAQIFRFIHPRRRGTGDLLIYLHQDFHNVGLGTAMLGRLLELAKKEGLHKLHLYVIAENGPAIRLYGKFGFGTEGVKKEAYLGEDGRYHDELIMGLVLG